MSKQSAINNILAAMRKQGKLLDAKGKGDLGEEAALQVILQIQNISGGMVFQSYKYPYQSNQQGLVYLGNIKYTNGEYTDFTDSSYEDEIDILYVTDRRVIPIEIKSYHAKIKVTEKWVYRGTDPVDKSPVAQAEKHARHLYHALKEVLPDGRPEYIKPMVCFVDRCDVNDTRREESIEYIPVCVLNGLKKCVNSINTPLRWGIDLVAVRQKLQEVCTSVNREYM